MEYYLGPDRKQKQKECIMIADTYTIVDPRAMMVESFHTLVADGAVTRTG
jgi:hypothetical protein